MMATINELDQAVQEVSEKARQSPVAPADMVKVVFAHMDCSCRFHYHVGWCYHKLPVREGRAIKYDYGTVSGSTTTIIRVLY